MAGQPPKFKTPDELQEKIKAYFDECEDKGRPLTVSGLAYGLGCNRDTLLNYGKKEEYFATISRAKNRIEVFAEESLYTSKNTHGVMFNLKNNFRWRDKQEIEQTGNVNIYFDEIDRALCENDDGN